MFDFLKKLGVNSTAQTASFNNFSSQYGAKPTTIAGIKESITGKKKKSIEDIISSPGPQSMLPNSSIPSPFYQQPKEKAKTVTSPVITSPKVQSTITEEKKTTEVPGNPVEDIIKKTEKTAKDLLIEKLTSASKEANDFNPVKRYEELSKTLGLDEARASVETYQKRISETNTLLDKLEGDIKSRTEDFIVSDPQRNRILAAESDPLIRNIGILQRGLETAQGGLKTRQEDIATRLGLEAGSAEKGLTQLEKELGLQEKITGLTDPKGQLVTQGNRIVRVAPDGTSSVVYEGPQDKSFESIKLDNGKTLIWDKKTGEIVKDLGGQTGGGGIGGLDGIAGDGDISFTDILAASRGGKQPVAAERQSLTKSFQVINQIEQLQSSIKDENTGPIMGIIRSNNPYDTKAQKIKAQLTSIIPILARGVFGEVGVLTDADVQLYAQTLPNLKSTTDVRNAVIGMTLKTVQRSIENQLEVLAASGIDVSGFANKYKTLKGTVDSIESSLGIKKQDGSEKKPGQELSDDEADKIIAEILGEQSSKETPTKENQTKIPETKKSPTSMWSFLK